MTMQYNLVLLSHRHLPSQSGFVQTIILVPLQIGIIAMYMQTHMHCKTIAIAYVKKSLSAPNVNIAIIHLHTTCKNVFVVKS